MSRTRTAIAATTAALCATVLVSNAGAEPTTQTPTVTPTVIQTVTVTPTITSTRGIPLPTETTTTTTEDTIMQAFSSGDFSNVSTTSIILFTLGIITGLLNLAMTYGEDQIQAMVDQARKALPF